MTGPSATGTGAGTGPGAGSGPGTETGPGPSVVVAGTGAFAAALVRALARYPRPVRTHVLSASAERAAYLAELAADHAFLTGARTTCTPHHIDPDDPEQPRRLLAALRPDILVVATSEQSPAEARTAPSAWTDLLRRAGFGLTLPFQAAAAMAFADARADAAPDTVLVNACFPDAVNPLLSATGSPVACGLGNVATLGTALSVRLGLSDQRRLRLLAHHAHLHAPADEDHDVLGWLDGAPLTDPRSALAAVRARPRGHLNEIGAVAGAAAVMALAGGGPAYIGHLPGPNGLPGGYPVTVHHHDVRLRLPPGFTQEEAVAWNLRRAELDGTVVGPDGVTHLTPTALTALRDHWPGAPARYPPDELPHVRDRMTRLRARLRLLPALPPSESADRHDH
ncbi:hypothetical protein [Streptomyces sp. DT171]|uniref:hypothetical protein n=1 Tax=Streptomyces sp. DT171 TaxID=3416524 RepID=UPI003CF04E65